MPAITDQTSWRKVNGWIIVIVVAFIAIVIVKCPIVAIIEIKIIIEIWSVFNSTQWIKAKGVRKIVVNIDRNPTISRELLCLLNTWPLNKKKKKQMLLKALNIVLS